MTYLMFALYGASGVLALLLLLLFFKPELITLPYGLFLRLFVKNPPYLDKTKYFPESKILEEHTEEIKAELAELLKEEKQIPTFHQIDSIQRYISNSDNIPWRTYILKAFDHWVDSNLDKVPTTKRLLEEMPQVTLAMFSILAPGKHIPKHFAFNKGVLRYHLGLVIPRNGECFIRNGGERYDWKEGEGVLFDDTYMHEVYNNSDEIRIVLFLDISRGDTLPNWIRPIDNMVLNIMSKSKRVKEGVKKSKVVFMDNQDGNQAA